MEAALLVEQDRSGVGIEAAYTFKERVNVPENEWAGFRPPRAYCSTPFQSHELSEVAKAEWNRHARAPKRVLSGFGILN